MTKRVFDNAMVAHVWAQQSQPEGRSSNGNFRFEGPVLYSYQTPVGNIVQGKNGLVALLTSHSYSITTNGKHLNPARSAIRHMTHFSVPFLGVTGGRQRGPLTLADTHKENVAAFAASYQAQKLKLEKAHTVYGSIAETLKDHADNATSYASAFGLKLGKNHWSAHTVDDAAAIEALRAAREAKNNTPAALAKRAREKEKQAAKVRDNYRAGGPIASTWRAQKRFDNLMSADDKAARAKAIRVRDNEKISAWIAGGPRFHFDAECGGAALRINGSDLETSHGASVPLAHAIRVFRFLKLCRERGEGWQANGHSLHVGHFTITEIEEDGSFKAGCHEIKWAEIERIAKLAGVWDAAPAADALTETKE